VRSGAEFGSLRVDAGSGVERRRAILRINAGVAVLFQGGCGRLGGLTMQRLAAWGAPWAAVFVVGCPCLWMSLWRQMMTNFAPPGDPQSWAAFSWAEDCGLKERPPVRDAGRGV